jgi:hypothetical protein
MKQNVKTTQPKEHPQPETKTAPKTTDASKSRSVIHNVSVSTIPASELQNMIATDLPGRYPITSGMGHKYLFVMYDTDSGYINAIPIKSRKSGELVKAYQTCYDTLKQKGLTARLMRIDNEVSAILIAAIESDGLNLQIVAPNDHRLNPAERAIQSFKAHFISTRSGVDPGFPSNRWDLLVPMTVLTLNLLRPSKINPAISAYTQVMGTFDFNRTPIGPVGCKLIVHDNRMVRGSWADHGTDGYFIGPAPRHYRNFTCWIPTTNATRISNTVEFFPTQNFLTKSDRLDRMGIIIQQLLDLLQEPTYDTMFTSPTTDLTSTIKEMRTLYGIPLVPLEPNTTSKGDRRPSTDVMPTNTAILYQCPDRPKTRTEHVYHNGTIVKKRFKEGNFEGEVQHYDPVTKYYKIIYEDGDSEEMTYGEVKEHYKPSQTYNYRAPRVVTPQPHLTGGTPPSPEAPNQTNGAKRNELRAKTGKKRRGRPKKNTTTTGTPVPTPRNKDNTSLRVKLHTRLDHNRLERLNSRARLAVTKERKTAFFTKQQDLAESPQLYKAFIAGAIWDKELAKWMRYNDLIKHPDKDVRIR